MQRLLQIGLMGLGAIAVSVSISSFATAQTMTVSNVGKPIAFSCSDPEATLKSKGVFSTGTSMTRFYVGYRQVSSSNQDAVVARFDRGRQTWCRSDYETTGADSRAYGAVSDGGSNLYVVFSTDGTQGTIAQDFRRFTLNGWLKSYGMGDGAKVAVIAKLNALTGMPIAGTFYSALLPANNKTNGLSVLNLQLVSSQVVVTGQTASYPRRVDRFAMVCSPEGSPYNQEIRFDGNLTSALSSVVDALGTGKPARCR